MEPTRRSNDDPNIADEARLWRRIHPAWYVPDAKTGERRLSSQAFQNGRTDDGKPANHMSVTLADHPLAPHSTEKAVSGKYNGYGLAEFTASLARRLDQGVTHTPTEEEPAHGSVTGEKTRAVINGFKLEAVLVKKPILQ